MKKKVLIIFKYAHHWNSYITEKFSNYYDTEHLYISDYTNKNFTDIVNDISGLTFDPNMLSYLSGKGIPVILMHINGRPKTMQNNPVYDDLIKDIRKFFLKQCNIAKENGIKKNHIILDPGIGFGKSFEHNFTVIRRLNEICDLGYPVMIGPSRKAFIGDTLGLPLNERIEGTLATVVAGIMNGAKIVRVHDIKEVKRAVKVTEKILASA